MSEMIAVASLEDLKRGYVEDEEGYLCICCGSQVEKGIIYPEDGILYEAGRYIRVHVEKEHGSVLEYLLSLDKSVTGLSDVQRNLLKLFYQGKSDSDIQKQLGIGSASTIRNHRFHLREKERQARVFLAMMELLQAKESKPRQKGADRTQDEPPAGGEEEKVLRKYYVHGTEGALNRFPAKDKERRIVLKAAAQRFEFGRRYSEKEINDILEAVYGDYALLRRYLVEYGYMDREADGSSYWLVELKKGGGQGMNRKEELKQLAKEIKTQAGVFQVRNVRNGKVWVEKSRNLKNMNGQEFQLHMGGHRNKALQQEWKEYGREAFVFEVLEVLEKKEPGTLDEKDALKKLKTKWLKQLQPYGEQGYNTPKEEE